MYGHHIQQSMDQPGKVANPARGQLNKENDIPLSPCVPENLVARDGFSRPVPRQPAHLWFVCEKIRDRRGREIYIPGVLLVRTRLELPRGLLVLIRRNLGSERRRYAIA